MDLYRSTTFDQIQRLSNERQHLYSQKWTKRNRPTYRESIKRLDRQIADLWHQHRCELAGAQPRTPINHKPDTAKWWANDSIWADTPSSQSSTEQMAVHNIREGMGMTDPVIELAEALVELGRDLIREVLAELREEDEGDTPVVPLAAILARRGETLRWRDIGHGRIQSYTRPMSTPP